jgi:hypothetical protein
MKVKGFNDFVTEALANSNSIKQLQKVMKMSAKTDISNRVNMEGGNLHFDRNPLTNIESYEDFEKKNKAFVSGWNFKNMVGPFK